MHNKSVDWSLHECNIGLIWIKPENFVKLGTFKNIEFFLIITDTNKVNQPVA